jgi:triacylglycerol esterase/lipase EstA (alpha/beta hydrolase family)
MYYSSRQGVETMRIATTGRRAAAAATASFVVCALLLLAGAAGAGASTGSKRNPVLFVHGIEGSGAQFESQAMRFTSNGYPHGWIDEVDYDSTRAVGDKTEVDQQIDAAIAALEKRTGKAKVDVVAHSLGTSVMYDYFTSGPTAAQRRASVRRYINVDGQSSNPGVKTLAVWAGRRAMGPHDDMPGAKNVTIPNQTHVQTCSSAQSFVQYYKFLTGRRPAHDIVRQRGTIGIAGKVLDFPRNKGESGATLKIWQVNGRGRRTTTAPRASLSIGESGRWGPVTVESGKRYEFEVIRPAVPVHHHYYEPFVRGDYAIRLLESDAITTYSGNRPGSLGVVNIRYKELWGDTGKQSDVLRINGLSVCNAVLCPWKHQTNAFFAFDRNRDGKTDLSTPDPVLSSLPFITGADVFIPASTPATGTTTFQLRSRGAGPVRTLKIPNWDSTTDAVTILWRDFERTDPPA